MGIKKAFSTLEILVSLSILVILITMSFSFIFLSIKQIIFYQRLIQANYLAQEGQEIARYFRQEKEEEINGFSRSIIFEEVYRDGNNNIALEGFLDEETKKVVVMVSFDNHQIELINYLTNWYEQ